MGEELHIDLGELLYNMKEKGLPDPSLVHYYKNIERRIITINSEIDDDMVYIAQTIIRWNQDDNDNGLEPKDRMPIMVMINSCGGDVDSAQFLCDVIEASTTPVYTIGMGICYSCGGIILMAGHKRIIHKSTKFLLHDGYVNVGGVASKFSDCVEFNKKTEAKIKDFVCSHTKISPEEYDKNYRSDWYMDSDEMIAYGVADEIVTKL